MYIVHVKRKIVMGGSILSGHTQSQFIYRTLQIWPQFYYSFGKCSTIAQ